MCSNVLIIALGKRPAVATDGYGEPVKEVQLWNPLEDPDVMEASETSSLMQYYLNLTFQDCVFHLVS